MNRRQNKSPLCLSRRLLVPYSSFFFFFFQQYHKIHILSISSIRIWDSIFCMLSFTTKGKPTNIRNTSTPSSTYELPLLESSIISFISLKHDFFQIYSRGHFQGWVSGAKTGIWSATWYFCGSCWCPRQPSFVPCSSHISEKGHHVALFDARRCK